MDHSATTKERYLTNSNALLDGLRLGGVGVWRWKVDTQDLQWTGSLEQVHHLPEGSFDGTIATFQGDIHPDDSGRVWEEITTSIKTGEPYKTIYRTRPRDGEEPLWIEACGAPVMDDGALYLTGACLDVTERVRFENMLRRRLRQQEGIEKLGTFALAETDFGRIMERAVEVAADIFDAPLAKILQFDDAGDHLRLVTGVGWNDGVAGTAVVDADECSQAGFTLLSKAPVIVHDLSAETRFSGPRLLREHAARSGMSVIIAGSG
ncbi:MAG TPA: PAS domain-containing protein, partial [Pararhizobium sp.]|nr:PAS domain-containing protein [Pararhizobium sp.]